VESYFANTSVALDHDVDPEPNDTQAVAFRPIVPRVAVNVGAEGLLARGVALLAADYDDRALFSPLVSVPVTESEGVRPSVTANEFAPDRPYALNALSQSLVVTPFQFRRRAKSLAASRGCTSGTQRQERARCSSACITHPCETGQRACRNCGREADGERHARTG